MGRLETSSKEQLSKEVNYLGAVKSLSRLGGITPLGTDIGSQRGTEEIPAERDKMERRPK